MFRHPIAASAAAIEQMSRVDDAAYQGA